MTVNHKKIYRLCKENNLLLSRKKKIKQIKKLAANYKITSPNKLWQFDIKYGYIHGEDRPFYFLAFIDVFNKKALSYHIGRSCTASDMKLTLKMALNSVSEDEQKNLIIRSDNGPQMSSNHFKAYIGSLDVEHEFTPIRCPDKNAFVESFFSIFEIEFLQVRYFSSMQEVHRQIRDWVEWYNTRRLHGSLKYNSPETFTEKFKKGLSFDYEVSA